MTISKSRNSNQILEGSRGTSKRLVDTSFAFVTDKYINNVLKLKTLLGQVNLDNLSVPHYSQCSAVTKECLVDMGGLELKVGTKGGQCVHLV